MRYTNGSEAERRVAPPQHRVVSTALTSVHVDAPRMQLVADYMIITGNVTFLKMALTTQKQMLACQAKCEFLEVQFLSASPLGSLYFASKVPQSECSSCAVFYVTRCM